jgi:outer membrane lipoprotein-sorting protein
MNKIGILFAGVVAVLLMQSICWGMTAEEVVKKSNLASYYQANDGRASVHMLITDSLGRTRERSMTILRMDDGSDNHQKYYVYFDKPNDVRGMTYLVWKNPGKDDDRWLYLPAMDLVRRIASGDKRSSFVGSHFAYEEISGRGEEEDTHTIIEETDDHYTIKSVPKDPSSVEFSYYVTIIDKKTFIPQKAELFDKNGKHYKTIEALEVNTIQGFPTITKMRATDLNSSGNTVSTFSDIEYDMGLDDGIFSERFLRRPPKQYI